MTNFSYKDFILTDPAPANPLWKLAAAAVVAVASLRWKSLLYPAAGRKKCDYEIYRDASDVFIPGFNA